MNRCSVLSIDAGGIKGYYSVVAINKIETEYGLNFNQEFDYYVGSSIGAVIAASLANDMKISEISNLFSNLETEINKGHQTLIKLLFEWIDCVFGEKRISELNKKIFIPVFNVSKKRATFFSNSNNNGNLLISDILKAACADLRIIKSYFIKDLNNEYADGGFFAYDPIMFFLRENENILSNELRIMSIGSGLIENVTNDLDTNYLFDTIYDSFLYEQFSVNKQFFKTMKIAHKNLSYLRLSEFPTTFDFSIQNLKSLAEQRVKEGLLQNKNQRKVWGIK